MRLLRTAPRSLAFALVAMAAVSANAFDWDAAREDSVVEVLTTDMDGAPRETPVWIVVLDGAGYVRTDDSRWLANIRRGSPVKLRVREVESAVAASETHDAALAARVEEAFKAKYGLTQKLMSLLRTSEPTVLRLDALEP